MAIEIEIEGKKYEIHETEGEFKDIAPFSEADVSKFVDSYDDMVHAIFGLRLNLRLYARDYLPVMGGMRSFEQAAEILLPMIDFRYQKWGVSLAEEAAELLPLVVRVAIENIYTSGRALFDEGTDPQVGSDQSQKFKGMVITMANFEFNRDNRNIGINNYVCKEAPGRKLGGRSSEDVFRETAVDENFRLSLILKDAMNSMLSVKNDISARTLIRDCLGD